jgi:tetratricopeptide (TPR) repeat protein
MPTDPYAADTLGWILYKRGDYRWALSLLQESAEKLSEEPAVLYHLGLAHYMMGEEKPAGTALQRALAMKKDFSGKDEAELCLSLLSVDAANASQKAIQSLEDRLARQPGDPVALRRLAAIYKRNGEETKAIRACEKALQANPKSATISIVSAEFYSRQPQGKDKAIDLAKKARNLAPEDPHVAHLLGRLAYDIGDSKWALSLLQESDRKAPGNADVLYDLGLAYYSLGRMTEAETAVQGALRASPTFARAEGAKRFLAMEAVCRKPAAAAEASAQVQQALRAEPDCPPAMLAAALIFEQQGKLQDAKPYYDKLASRFPLFPPALKRLAVLYGEHLGDDPKAYEYGTKARELSPDDAEVARVLGSIAYRRQDYTKAAQLLKESVSKGGGTADSYFCLGMAYYRLKKVSESKEMLTKALTVNPNAKFAAEAMQVLTQLK